MTRPAVLFFLAIASSLAGCEVIRGTVAPERAPPALCLSPPAVPTPCQLAAWWDTASAAEKAGLELQCKAVDTVAIRERDARLADCRAWFDAGKGTPRR